MELAAENVSIRFGGVAALQGTNLRLETNTILGVIGPNGAGKSTLTNVMSGVVRPSSGTMRLDGREITGATADAYFRMGVARTFQSMRLFADLTVFENIEVAASAKEKRLAARSRVAQIIDELGPETHTHSLAAALPYGVQKLVALGRAMASNPHFLLLDEPAAGLNDVESAVLMVLVKRIRESRGIGILLIDHDMPFIMGSCDRLVVLANGQKLADGSPDEIRANNDVISAYLGY